VGEPTERVLPAVLTPPRKPVRLGRLAEELDSVRDCVVDTIAPLGGEVRGSAELGEEGDDRRGLIELIVRAGSGVRALDPSVRPAGRDLAGVGPHPVGPRAVRVLRATEKEAVASSSSSASKPSSSLAPSRASDVSASSRNHV